MREGVDVPGVDLRSDNSLIPELFGEAARRREASIRDE